MIPCSLLAPEPGKTGHRCRTSRSRTKARCSRLANRRISGRRLRSCVHTPRTPLILRQDQRLAQGGPDGDSPDRRTDGAGCFPPRLNSLVPRHSGVGQQRRRAALILQAGIRTEPRAARGGDTPRNRSGRPSTLGSMGGVRSSGQDMRRPGPSADPRTWRRAPGPGPILRRDRTSGSGRRWRRCWTRCAEVGASASGWYRPGCDRCGSRRRGTHPPPGRGRRRCRCRTRR